MPRRLLAFDPTPEGLVSPLRLAHKGLWKRIRDRRFAAGGFACDLCGVAQPDRRRLPAHEVYGFNRPGVVRLERVVFLCTTCHDAIHLERTRRVAGAKWIGEVEAHYCRVNKVRPAQMERDYAAMMKASAAMRSAYRGRAKPVMDYGDYQAEADAAEGRKRTDGGDDDGDFEMYPDHECPWDVGHAD